MAVEVEELHPFARTVYELRCEAEGIGMDTK